VPLLYSLGPSARDQAVRRDSAAMVSHISLVESVWQQCKAPFFALANFAYRVTSAINAPLECNKLEFVVNEAKQTLASGDLD